MPETTFVAEPGKHAVVLTHVVDAPRELVFKTITDPSLIDEWWGPRELTTKVEKMDVRPGGMWRFVQKDPNGNEFAFWGLYHTVLPNEKLAYTFEFEGMPGHVMMETVTFEDLDGMTKVTDSPVFQTVEDRDMTLKSGMERGARESMARFDELIARISKESSARVY
jgi:uncharacterized protein YndB with AHSA1/START domain